MAERGRGRKRKGGEPTLADQIAESGETEKDERTVQLDEAREDLRFLGREFCAWLIYHADGEDGVFGRGTALARASASFINCWNFASPRSGSHSRSSRSV